MYADTEWSSVGFLQSCASPLDLYCECYTGSAVFTVDEIRGSYSIISVGEVILGFVLQLNQLESKVHFAAADAAAAQLY